MTVWLAYQDIQHEGREVVGIFSSKIEAVSFLENNYQLGWNEDMRVDYYVEEEEVK